MSTWADPLGDLRRLIADSLNDNLVKEKKLFGPCTGQNRTFFTFEDRLLTSGYQDTQPRPLRVFLTTGGSMTEVAASGIYVPDRLRGECQLMVMPSGAVKVTGSYYYQEHLDVELNEFLQQAAYQVNANLASDVPVGLQLAALHIAASMAHTRAMHHWQQRKSEQFLLQDEPARQEAEGRISFHREEADRLLRVGYEARESFYNLRMDKGRAPAFGLLQRIPSPYTPRR